MSERQRKNYDRKFKEETVKYIQQHSKPVTEIAVEMNIPVGTLNNWLLRYRQSPDEPFVGSGNIRQEDKRVEQLEQYVRDLEEEVAILKKAVHIFSKNAK